MELLTLEQLRAGRAWLGLSQRAMAERAGVSKAALGRLEAGVGGVEARLKVQGKMVRSFSAAGIQLLDCGIGSLGVSREAPETALKTGRQVRVARAWLGLAQKDVAAHAGVSPHTIMRIESADGVFDAMHLTHAALEALFRDRGIRFVENGILFEAPDHADGG